MSISPDLLALLRCPDTRAPLVLDGEFLVSTHPEGRRRYAIAEGIPNMIIEESEVLEPEAWVEIMTRHGVFPGDAGGGGRG